MGKRKASLFVIQTGDEERDECGLGLQGLTTLVTSLILDITSVTLSTGGQVFQIGPLEGGRSEEPKLVSNHRKTSQRPTANELVSLERKRALQPPAVGSNGDHRADDAQNQTSNRREDGDSPQTSPKPTLNQTPLNPTPSHCDVTPDSLD